MKFIKLNGDRDSLHGGRLQLFEIGTDPAQYYIDAGAQADAILEACKIEKVK